MIAPLSLGCGGRLLSRAYETAPETNQPKRRKAANNFMMSHGASRLSEARSAVPDTSRPACETLLMANVVVEKIHTRRLAPKEPLSNASAFAVTMPLQFFFFFSLSGTRGLGSPFGVTHRRPLGCLPVNNLLSRRDRVFFILKYFATLLRSDLAVVLGFWPGGFQSIGYIFLPTAGFAFRH
jgi:hypothetical protein